MGDIGLLVFEPRLLEYKCRRHETEQETDSLGGLGGSRREGKGIRHQQGDGFVGDRSSQFQDRIGPYARVN